MDTAITKLEQCCDLVKASFLSNYYLCLVFRVVAHFIKVSNLTSYETFMDMGTVIIRLHLLSSAYCSRKNYRCFDFVTDVITCVIDESRVYLVDVVGV